VEAGGVPESVEAMVWLGDEWEDERKLDMKDDRPFSTWVALDYLIEQIKRG
jgi:hypothetical protein